MNLTQYKHAVLRGLRHCGYAEHDANYLISQPKYVHLVESGYTMGWNATDVAGAIDQLNRRGTLGDAFIRTYNIKL